MRENYEFYDLKKNNYPAWVKTAFQNSLADIANSTHQLKNNYLSKELKLNKMASFIAVVNPIEKDLICFSGLQINSWKYPISRISSRHWFSDKYASKYLRKQINWKICVVEQIKVAIEQGYDKMFFSTELSVLDKIFDKQCSRSTTSINTIIPNVKIVPLKNYYDTTGKPSWQRIGQVIIDNKSWDFPLTEGNKNGN